MSQAEILRFREIARTRSETPDELAYVKFFLVLTAQTPFNKKKIKEALVGTSTLKRLGDSLCYLYHALLKALQSSNDNLTKDVSDLAAQMQVLLHKGLHHQIPILGKQAMANAVEIEDFESQLNLIRLHRTSIINTCKGRDLGEKMESLDSLEDSIWSKIENLRLWERLRRQRFIAKTLAPSEEMLLLNEIENHPYVMNQGPALSIKAEIAKLSLNEKLLSSRRLDNFERIPVLMEISERIESKPSLLGDALIVERFLYATFNAGVLATMVKNEGLATQAIEKLEWFSRLQPEADVLVFERVELIKFIRILDDLDLVQGQVVAKRIKKGLDKFGDRVSRLWKLDLVLYLSYFYLISGKRTETIKLLHPILETPPIPENENRSLLIWILFLIAHFEHNNIEVLASHSLFAKNYMRTYRLDNELCKRFFTFFASSATLNEPSRRQNLTIVFQTETVKLLQLADNSYYAAFNLGLWLESNVGKKSWLQLIGDSKASD